MAGTQHHNRIRIDAQRPTEASIHTRHQPPDNPLHNPALPLKEEIVQHPQEKEKPRVQGAPTTAAEVPEETRTIRIPSSSWTTPPSTAAGRPDSS